MSRYLTRAAKVLDEREKSRRSEVYDNIGRETFVKIAREEDLLKSTNECQISIQSGSNER